jgi:sporulation integral membrane protein YlbJ
MFGQPALGAALALAHYASGLSVGVIYRFYGRGRDPVEKRARPVARDGLLRRALDEMYRARLEDGRAMGRVVNEAISESVSTLFMIMSFIVLFAVMLRVLGAAGILSVLGAPLQVMFGWVGLSPHLVPAALQGLFEIDLGSAAAATAHAPLIERLVLVSAIIAWSGLSVHGQVASVLTGTDISMKPYFAARFIHAILAGLYTLVFVRPAEAVVGGLSLPAFAGRDWVAAAPVGSAMVDGLHYAVLLAGFSLAGMALSVIVVGTLRAGRILWMHIGVR